MLEVKDIFCGYGNEDVIKGISFSLSENKILSVIGPNGCGKTTLLWCLSGITKYKGSILFNGIQISDMKRKEVSKKIALMSQMSGNLFDFSVYETVKLGTYANSRNKDVFSTDIHAKEKTLYYIEKVGLSDVCNKSILELSGGQLQRAFLARAFVQEPDIILLDEPTNHLDLKYQLELMDYLKEWSREKSNSVISVMHDINLSFTSADEVVLMNEGKIALKGIPSEIINSDKLEKVYNTDVKEYMKSSYSRWK